MLTFSSNLALKAAGTDVNSITHSPAPSWWCTGCRADACVLHAAGQKGRSTEQERRKGIPWTEDEHRLFLLGLAKFGKGDWRSISRSFVMSRTPTQARPHSK